MTSRLDWSVSRAMGEQISLNSPLRTEPFNRPLLPTLHQYFSCSIYIHHGTCSVRLAVPLCFYLFILFIYILPSWHTDKLQLFPTISGVLKQCWMKDAFGSQQAAVIQSDRQKWSGHWSEVGCSKSVTDMFKKLVFFLDGDNHQDLLFLLFLWLVCIPRYIWRHFILSGY